MPARKAPADEPATKPAKRSAKKPAPKPQGELVVTKKAKPPQATPPASGPTKSPPPKAPAKRRAPDAPKVEKTRVVVPKEFYELHKDDVKAPLKDAKLKWNFLGEGKGLYKREDNGVHCFVQFRDDGIHYSVWGADRPAVDLILAAWRRLLGEEGYAKATASGEQAVATEAAQAETEAVRVWKLSEPQRRPGEPDLFFQKRMAEWQAKRPA